MRADGIKSKLSEICDLELKKFSAGDSAYEAYAVKDMDQLVDWLIEQGDDHPDVADERLPYWAEVWPSSLALAEYLKSADWISSEMMILELGCGPGLAGLGAVKYTADITLSDYQLEALELSKLNWLHSIGREPKTLLLDWRYPDETMKYDILLASDVAYESRFFEPILNTFRKMTKPNGLIILSEPRRPLAKDFFELLEKQGWSCQKLSTVEVESKAIDIYKIISGV